MTETLAPALQRKGQHLRTLSRTSLSALKSAKSP
jgi:hypothetical protein